MNRQIGFLGISLVCAGMASSGFAAMSEFTASTDTVIAGTLIPVEVEIVLEELSDLSRAVVSIGSNGATDLDFTYSTAWTNAFSVVPPPTFDTGLYAQDVFVSGQSQVPLGVTRLSLGTITIDTAGMVAGTYSLVVDGDSDGESVVGLVGEETREEPIFGTFHFSVTEAAVVPAPGAALLGAVGLGLVGWLKRRYA